MLKNTPEHGRYSSDSASSDHSHGFWEIRREAVQHCRDGIKSSIKIACLIGIVAGAGHYCQAGETENHEKEKIEVDAGQTEMYPQMPSQKDFSQREPKFLE